jgi:hypothetical protein
MFGTDWLREGVPVDNEASVLTNEAEVVAGDRARARAMIDRHPGREPDSFRFLTDASGKIFGVFPIAIAGADVDELFHWAFRRRCWSPHPEKSMSTPTMGTNQTDDALVDLWRYRAGARTARRRRAAMMDWFIPCLSG